jgi:hypothetical protein
MLLVHILTLSSSINTFASYHIGANTIINQEEMPSFAKANPRPLLIKASTMHNPSLGLLLLKPLLDVHDCACKCRSSMKA